MRTHNELSFCPKTSQIMTESFLIRLHVVSRGRDRSPARGVAPAQRLGPLNTISVMRILKKKRIHAIMSMNFGIILATREVCHDVTPRDLPPLIVALRDPFDQTFIRSLHLRRCGSNRFYRLP